MRPTDQIDDPTWKDIKDRDRKIARLQKHLIGASPSRSSSTGWCLRSPKGKLIQDTFDRDKGTSWAKAFNHLDGKSWMSPYWKKWDESIAAAAERGWVMVRVRLVPHG